MEKIAFSIFINAPVSTVWAVMLGPDSYREWTSAFSPDSHYVGSWEEGASIRFLGECAETGELGGMIARIAENRKHAFISIEHIGIVENGVDDYTSEKVTSWMPAFENYTFTEKDGGTELIVDMDTLEENQPMFDDMWPRALALLKEIVERR